MYIQRVLAKQIKRHINSFPVLGLTGPRQSGKSTMLKNILPDYKYITFDEDINISAFESDPQEFMKQYSDKVIFDEVQYVPKLFNIIKAMVDKDRMNYGRFILTGSSQFNFLKNVSESLAGRIGLISLLPFQWSEMPKALTTESIYQGAYPELVMRSYNNADLWYSSYIDTYLTKDIRSLAEIGNIRDFRRLIQLLAANISNPLDMTKFANDIGVSVPTIKRWISVLEASYVIFLLPPFYNNYGRRIIKSPKIYFYDTGIVSHLTGVSTFELYDKGPLAGSIFENYIIIEILKNIKHNCLNFELYYLRTQDKAEVDLIVDKKITKDFIEIKKTHSYTPRMSTSIKRYAGENDNKIILYNGDYYEHGDVKVLPYYKYFEADII